MRRILITVLLLTAGVVVAVLLNRLVGRRPTEIPAAPNDGTAPPLGSATVSSGVVAADDPGDAGVEDLEAQPFRFDLAELDYEELRRRTPDSLYWLMAAPTDDPALRTARARAREERNRQYGKVVSNTATVEEIRDYYAYRRKLSEDYIEVLQLILDDHGDELSERDAGLFELTISMHAARLAEIPAKLDDAMRRKAEYDRVKAEWREQRRKDPESGL
jgi:hypothetical protein